MKLIILVSLTFFFKNTLQQKSISICSEEHEKKFEIKIINKESKCENSEFVNLDKMRLQIIKDDIIKSDAIQSISLHDNFLEKVPQNILNYVTHLSCFNLSRNSINLYKSNQIVHPYLRILDLSYQEMIDVNSISEVETFEETEDVYKYMIFNSTRMMLENLEYLDLSGNDISALMWEFNMSFPRLTRLDLININAVKLEPHFFDKISTTLRALHLENNYLRNLTLRNVAEITSLYLDGNIFETLDITSTKLRTLSLANCTNLSKGFFDTPNLEELDLSRNNFDNASGIRFEMFPSLRVLLLDYNKLSYVPILNLQWLNELSISYNMIKNIKPNSFGYLTSLRKLLLKGNKIERLEKEIFSRLEKLEYLDLSENRLNHLSTDWAILLTKLQYLNLNSNQFASIAEMNVFTINSLQHLFVKNNIFKITTTEIEPLPKYITIYLA